MSIIIKETLRQPRAVLAVDALLSGPLLAVSMDVFRDEVQHRSFRDEMQHRNFRDEVLKALPLHAKTELSMEIGNW